MGDNTAAAPARWVKVYFPDGTIREYANPQGTGYSDGILFIRCDNWQSLISLHSVLQVESCGVSLW